MTEIQDADVCTKNGSGSVRTDCLIGYKALAAELGGDADALLRNAGIEPDLLSGDSGLVPYRSLVELLETTAAETGCLDFGMRLAALQGGGRVLGPLGIAMDHSQTIEAAFRYCERNLQVYSLATRIGLEIDEDVSLITFEILIGRLPTERQAIEHALLLTHRNVESLSRGQVIAREIWFKHDPIVPPSVYRSYFRCPVHFMRRANAVVLRRSDLQEQIPGRDPRIYELARSFIDDRYPAAKPQLVVEARIAIEKLLMEEHRCTLTDIGRALGIHRKRRPGPTLRA